MPDPILLPQFVGGTEPGGLFEVCTKVSQSDAARIEIDCSRVKFIDPLGLAVLAALIHPLQVQGRVVSMPWLDRNLIGYMTRMDFFKQCPVDAVDVPVQGRNALPERLVELKHLVGGDDTDVVAGQLADTLTGHLTPSAPDEPFDMEAESNQYGRFRKPIWYALTEMLDNACTHARRKGNRGAGAWVSAQYYAKSKMVRLAVVDNGCGLLATLEKHPDLVEESHLGAIRTALLPKVSCNRIVPFIDDHGNQGVGLTTTSRIAAAAGGTLQIATGDSLFNTRRNLGYTLPNGGSWNGVAIAFSAVRHNLPAIRIPHLLPPIERPPTVHLNFT